MKRTTITALIDTYNQGRYVEEAIESVLAQDVAPGEMEVLVVDDGSTDDTAARVAKFGERVRYIQKENGGQASALNAGFAEARGEIIALLDADDLWLPGKVRRVLEEFEQHPEAGMVYHGYQWWNEKTGQCIADPTFRALTGYMPDRIEDVLTFGNVGTCGVALRRGTIEKLMPIPERLVILADAYFVFVAAFASPVAGISDFLTRVRLHDDNRFNFQRNDAAAAQRRWQCARVAVEEQEAWLRRNGFEESRREIAAFVKRARLWEQMIHFQCETPSRRDFYGYLRDYNELYGQLWSGEYRLIRSALPPVGFFLGYKTYEALRKTYADSAALVRLREALFAQPAKELTPIGETSEPTKSHSRN